MRRQPGSLSRSSCTAWLILNTPVQKPGLEPVDYPGHPREHIQTRGLRQKPYHSPLTMRTAVAISDNVVPLGAEIGPLR